MCGDLLIRQTLHHHLQYLPLPKGEVFWRSLRVRIGASLGFVGLLAGMSEQTLAHEIGQIARKRKQSSSGAIGGCGYLSSSGVAQKNGLHSCCESSVCAEKICFFSQKHDRYCE